MGLVGLLRRAVRAGSLQVINAAAILSFAAPYYPFLNDQQTLTERDRKHALVVVIVDENNVAVRSARVTLTHAGTQNVLTGDTDYTGRCRFAELDAGMYDLRAEREGFYATHLPRVHIPETSGLELVLNHQQEFAETMDVVYSPAAIDPAKTVAAETLTSREIINLPYSTSRDIRNLLPFLPGIVQDTDGNVHVNGSAADQLLSTLDGFNVSHPVTGLLDTRVSVDALRTIEVQSSRYSAEHGKASGGVLNLTTGIGDDRYRFSATNFVPSFQTTRGVALDNWTPRASLSGPLRKKKAWFLNAADAEYNLDIVKELPEDGDRNLSKRLGNLFKTQINVTQTDIVTIGFLINDFRADHVGLTPFNPAEATRRATRTAHLLTLKEQSYIANRALLEFGLALNKFGIDEIPAGSLPFVSTPEGTRGNHFETARSDSQRLQLIANLVLPSLQWKGKHELKVGTGLDRIDYDQFIDRRPITVLREDRTLARLISFEDSRSFSRSNLETSGFVQDRWSVSNRVLVELGIRVDWDLIFRDVTLSPRVASAIAIGGGTKLSGGIGLYHDATNLELISKPLFGKRSDSVFSENGQTLIRRLETSFGVQESSLDVPRYLNWSLGFERQLPASLVLGFDFIRKRTSNGLAFVNRNGLSEPAGAFELRNERKDRYYSFQATLRKLTRGRHAFFAAYTHSSARSNTLFDFGFDNPAFHQPVIAPLAWDAPNRLIAWGWSPLIKQFELSYSVDWRDGFPYNVVNQDQQLVGPPNSNRFPRFFSLNLHAERRLKLFGAQWALRAGFNNITNRQNPTSVNNSVDSPRFMTFAGFQDRAFTGRIRFLGRK